MVTYKHPYRRYLWLFCQYLKMELVCYPYSIRRNELPTIPCKIKTIHMNHRPKRSLLSTSMEIKKKNEKMKDAIAKHLCSGIQDSNDTSLCKTLHLHKQVHKPADSTLQKFPIQLVGFCTNFKTSRQNVFIAISMVIAGAYWIKSSNCDFKTHDDALTNDKATLTKK